MMLSNFEKFKDTDEVREQMPEEWSSMPRFLNLFPGITQEYLNKPEQTSEKRTTYSLMIPHAWPEQRHAYAIPVPPKSSWSNERSKRYKCYFTSQCLPKQPLSVQTFPVQTPSIQPFPVQTPSIQPFPVQTPSIQPFPVQTSSIQSFPMQTPPMPPFPVQTPSIQSFPVQTPPKQSFPMQTPSIQSFPVQTPPTQPFPVQTPPTQPFPVQTSPIQSVPVQTPPTQSFPMQTTSIQSLPMQTPPMQMFPKQTPMQSPYRMGAGCFGAHIPVHMNAGRGYSLEQSLDQMFMAQATRKRSMERGAALKIPDESTFIFPEIHIYKYEIHIEVLVEEPDKKQNQTDACNWLLQSLNDKQEILENYLSSELETRVVVDKIDGNVVHISTDDEQDSEVLHFLSDTGLLASMIQYKLDFKKEHFCFDKIMLKVKLIKVAENTSYGYLHLKTMTKLKRQNQQPEKCKRIKIDYKK